MSLSSRAVWLATSAERLPAVATAKGMSRGNLKASSKQPTQATADGGGTVGPKVLRRSSPDARLKRMLALWRMAGQRATNVTDGIGRHDDAYVHHGVVVVVEAGLDANADDADVTEASLAGQRPTVGCPHLLGNNSGPTFGTLVWAMRTDSTCLLPDCATAVADCRHQRLPNLQNAGRPPVNTATRTALSICPLGDVQGWGGLPSKIQQAAPPPAVTSRAG